MGGVNDLPNGSVNGNGLSLTVITSGGAVSDVAEKSEELSNAESMDGDCQSPGTSLADLLDNSQDNADAEDVALQLVVRPVHGNSSSGGPFSGAEKSQEMNVNSIPDGSMDRDRPSPGASVANLSDNDRDEADIEDVALQLVANDGSSESSEDRCTTTSDCNGSSKPSPGGENGILSTTRSLTAPPDI
ncbi:hypothetical protein EST38_g13189 [Candolleomyces aberdarensis]|uniref:Uncharacterized protein n=1 Tax=Candolleomyces aberdarensis TaxID=2316362 RepID=A0A4Q2D2V2_9AGAR|nr:hypothetical protein EST38_g13189 [Candolleomyces aberdarensis]